MKDSTQGLIAAIAVTAGILAAGSSMKSAVVVAILAVIYFVYWLVKSGDNSTPTGAGGPECENIGYESHIEREQ